jgi:hypothetical protein
MVMETILIWLGSGFAFACGFFAGLMALTIGTKKGTKTDKYNAESIELLSERNKIGWRQIEALERIAAATEKSKTG